MHLPVDGLIWASIAFLMHLTRSHIAIGNSTNQQSKPDRLFSGKQPLSTQPLFEAAPEVKQNTGNDVNADKHAFRNQGNARQRKFDYIIVGAGPAGLQMAYFLQQAGRDYVVLERANCSGSFFRDYPRHNKLISINKRFTGKRNKRFNERHDWNSLLSHNESLLFKHYSKDFFPIKTDMVRYLRDYADILKLNIEYNTEVSNIHKRNVHESTDSDLTRELFFMEDQNKNAYVCRSLLIATGMWKPNYPQIKGLDLAIGYEDIPDDPRFYEGKNILILGQGNAAFETAQAAYGYANVVHVLGRSRVKLAWETHYVGDVRGVNNELLDTYQLKSLDGVVEGPLTHITFIKDGDKIILKQLHGRNSDNFALRQHYDVIIRCLGWRFDRSLFNSALLRKSKQSRKEKYLQLDDDYQVPEVPGMYVLGTASHVIDYRKSAGGFIHGFRYTVEAVHHILEHTNHNVQWPSTMVDVTDLVTTLLKRVNEGSAIYQMFGILGDVILFNRTSVDVHYMEAFPLKLLPKVRTFCGWCGNELIVMVLEYGRGFSGPGKDVFRQGRSMTDPAYAHKSNFLHPVFYHYKNIPTSIEMKHLVGEWSLPRPHSIHHSVEDFLAVWDTPHSHVLPLRRFTENVLRKDLRNRLNDECFINAMLYKDLPSGCQDFIKGRGLNAFDISSSNNKFVY